MRKGWTFTTQFSNKVAWNCRLLLSLRMAKSRLVHGTNCEMSPIGTFQTRRSCLLMSVYGGTAENICSQRVFRILTQLGHLARFGVRDAGHSPDARL
jgi:hypothetical protein